MFLEGAQPSWPSAQHSTDSSWGVSLWLLVRLLLPALLPKACTPCLADQLLLLLLLVLLPLGGAPLAGPSDLDDWG